MIERRGIYRVHLSRKATVCGDPLIVVAADGDEESFTAEHYLFVRGLRPAFYAGSFRVEPNYESRRLDTETLLEVALDRSKAQWFLHVNRVCRSRKCRGVELELEQETGPQKRFKQLSLSGFREQLTAIYRGTNCPRLRDHLDKLQWINRLLDIEFQGETGPIDAGQQK